MEIEEKIDKTKKIIAELKNCWVFVEGQKDKKALYELGITKVLTISGNLRLSCNRVDGMKVFVLTDLDRRGDELTLKARDELEGHSIRAELEMRKKLAYLLGIRNFENAKSAYDKLIETK